MSLCRYNTSKPCENHGTSSRTCLDCVLDEIRAEVEMEKQEDFPNFCIMAHNGAIERVLRIIDKYRAEGSGEK